MNKIRRLEKPMLEITMNMHIRKDYHQHSLPFDFMKEPKTKVVPHNKTTINHGKVRFLPRFNDVTHHIGK